MCFRGYLVDSKGKDDLIVQIKYMNSEEHILHSFKKRKKEQGSQHIHSPGHADRNTHSCHIGMLILTALVHFTPQLLCPSRLVRFLPYPAELSLLFLFSLC